MRAKRWWHTLSCPSVERAPIGLSQHREAHKALQDCEIECMYNDISISTYITTRCGPRACVPAKLLAVR